MSNPTGFTPEQIKAIKALERVLRKCDGVGLQFYGIDSELYAMNIYADNEDLSQRGFDTPEEVSLCLDGAPGTHMVNTSRTYIDSAAS